MLEFNINFNYKTERRRTWTYFIVPKVIGLLLMTLSHLVLDEARPLMDIFVYEVYPSGLRIFIWVIILTAYTIFLRNLNDRFGALNSLLRFAN